VGTVHNSALTQLKEDPNLRITLQEDHASALCEVQFLSKENKHLNTYLKETQEKLTSAEHRISYLDTLVKTSNAESTDFKNQCQHLTNKLRDEELHRKRLEVADADNLQQNKLLETQLKTAHEKIKDLNLQLTSLKLTAQQDASSYSTDKDSYDKKVRELQEHISTLQEELKESQATSKTHSDSLDEAVSDITGLRAEITELKQQNNDQNDVIIHLQAQVNQNSPRRPQLPNVNIQDDIEMANLVTALTDSLQEILSHQHKQQIPLYSGFLNDQPIEDWLKDAERTARTAGWTDALKLKYFQDRLRGVSATYNDEYVTGLQNQGTPITYQDWKQAMIARFQDSDAKDAHKFELEQLQQGPNQRVNDFKSFIDQKFIKAYGNNASQSADNEMKQIREDIKKKILLKGLKPKIIEQLWHRIDPTSGYDSIVAEAINVEKMLQRKESMNQSRSTSPSANLIQTTLEHLTDKINALTLKTDSLASKGNINVNTIDRRSRSSSFDRSDYRSRSLERDSPRSRSQERRFRPHSRSPGRKYPSSNNFSRMSRSKSPRARSSTPTGRNFQATNAHRSRSRSASQERNRNQGWTAQQDNYQKKKQVVFQEDTKDRNQGPCYTCGKTGHLARNCRMTNQN
jgi:Zinc knuckle